MPKRDLPWYKWWPSKALSSVRWAQLTLEQEGFYRRLYDLAALSKPDDKRGWLYDNGQPLAEQTLWHLLRTHHTKGRALLRQLASKGLVTQDANGAWGFPEFAKHQRGAYLRPSTPGRQAPRKEQDRNGIGALEGEVDVEVDVEVDKEGERGAPGSAPNSPPSLKPQGEDPDKTDRIPDLASPAEGSMEQAVVSLISDWQVSINHWFGKETKEQETALADCKRYARTPERLSALYRSFTKSWGEKPVQPKWNNFRSFMRNN